MNSRTGQARKHESVELIFALYSRSGLKKHLGSVAVLIARLGPRGIHKILVGLTGPCFGTSESCTVNRLIPRGEPADVWGEPAESFLSCGENRLNY